MKKYTLPAHLRDHMVKFDHKIATFQSAIDAVRETCRGGIDPWFDKRLAVIRGSLKSIHLLIGPAVHSGRCPSPAGGKSWTQLSRELGLNPGSVKQAIWRGDSVDDIRRRAENRRQIQLECEAVARRFNCPYKQVYRYYYNHKTLKDFDPKRPQGRQKSVTQVLTPVVKRKAIAIARRFNCPYKQVYRYYYNHKTFNGFDPKRSPGRPSSRVRIHSL